MRRPLLLALLASCGGGTPIPATDLLLRIDPGAFEVELGRAFPLTVVRVWGKDLVPDEWSGKALAPLALKLAGETRRDDGKRVEETRRYEAHVFSLKDVVIRGPKLTARPRDGGPERKVSVTGFRIRVKPALDPEAPGPPELPGEPPPSRGWMWGGAGALAAALILLLALRKKPKPKAPPPAPPAPPPVPAHERALERLRAAPAEEAADIVRAYLAEAKGVRALEMTSEQILLALPSSDLGAVLRPCDLVKFAGATLADGERVLAAAEAFVRETAP